jgi:hypothetical protein
MSDIVTTTLSGVPALWSKRVPFDCNGTLRAVVIDSDYQISRLVREYEKFRHSTCDTDDESNPFGRLSKDHGWTLVSDMLYDGPVYVVYSYDTPIAWVTKSGREVKPSAKYSATTSKHLGKLYKV